MTKASAQTVQSTLVASRALTGVVARSMGNALDQVSLPQFRILVLLAASGPLRTGVLAERTGVHPSTLTRTADRLVRGGWVRRVDNPMSRREVLVELTDNGAALVGEVMASRKAQVAEILSRVSRAQHQVIVAGFTAFAEAAGEPSPQDLLVLGS